MKLLTKRRSVSFPLATHNIYIFLKTSDNCMTPFRTQKKEAPLSTKKMEPYDQGSIIITHASQDTLFEFVKSTGSHVYIHASHRRTKFNYIAKLDFHDDVSPLLFKKRASNSCKKCRIHSFHKRWSRMIMEKLFSRNTESTVL